MGFKPFRCFYSQYTQKCTSAVGFLVRIMKHPLEKAKGRPVMGYILHLINAPGPHTVQEAAAFVQAAYGLELRVYDGEGQVLYTPNMPESSAL